MTAPYRSYICPVCEATSVGTATQRVWDRRKGLQGSWEVVTCGTCRTLFIDPMPYDEVLSGYYGAYLRETKVVLRDGFGSKRPTLRRIYHLLSGDVDPRDFVAVEPGSKVLDYGSGGGTYLSFFASQGIDIVGAEISDVMIAACAEAGLKMKRVENFDTIPFPDSEFDIVYLMQVFEHLRRPRLFMQELNRILKPGGALHLAVPNAASGWQRFFGINWVSGWFAPFHLAHYTRESLTQLGLEFGFVVTDSWSRTPESWFRLNLKAALHRNDNQIEARSSLLDSLPVKLGLMGILRAIEFLLRERDCLVVSFQKV